jgi:hypothetical protein
MKKQILFATAVLVSASMIITGCKKDDTSAPVITLNGDAAEQSVLNAAWTDKGATAEDDQDGAVDVTVSGTVNKDLAGPYTITYTATDAAGNTATETRVVTVYNEAKTWEGTYSKAMITDSTYGNAAHTNYTGPYTWLHDCIITASTTVNKMVIVDPFLDYANIAASEKISGTVTGTTLTISSQTAHSIGSNSHDHTFQGSASISTGTTTTIHFVTSDHDITSNSDAFDVWTLKK